MTHHVIYKILLLAAVLTAAMVPGVHAQGQGQGNQGQGQGNQGQGASSQSQGNAGGGAGNPGNPGGNAPGGAGAPPGTSGNPFRSGDAEFALEAVRSNRAVPLAEILATAREAAVGEVIDARLVTLRGFLVYEVKSLSPGGQVKRTYYYARSGRKVGSD